MQKSMTGAVAAHERASTRAACDHRVVKAKPGQSETDMFHTCLVTARSQQTRILQCPLLYLENRVSAMAFVFFMRFYLRMAPLIKRGRATQPISECGGEEVPISDRVNPPHNNRDYVEEVCALNHGHQCGLGPTAAHCVHYPSTFGGCYGTHNAYTRVVQEAKGRLDLITS